MDLCGFHNISVIQLIKYYNYSQNMGIYSIIPGFCGAPWAVGAPRIVTTFHPSSDGPEYKLLRARVGLGLVTLIRCQARAGLGPERLGPGPG